MRRPLNSTTSTRFMLPRSTRVGTAAVPAAGGSGTADPSAARRPGSAGGPAFGLGCCADAGPGGRPPTLVGSLPSDCSAAATGCWPDACAVMTGATASKLRSCGPSRPMPFFPGADSPFRAVYHCRMSSLGDPGVEGGGAEAWVHTAVATCRGWRRADGGRLQPTAPSNAAGPLPAKCQDPHRAHPPFPPPSYPTNAPVNRETVAAQLSPSSSRKSSLFWSSPCTAAWDARPMGGAGGCRAKHRRACLFLYTHAPVLNLRQAPRPGTRECCPGSPMLGDPGLSPPSPLSHDGPKNPWRTSRPSCRTFHACALSAIPFFPGSNCPSGPL